ELRELLGRGRANKGIFEGDLTEGELEIGQIASHIRKILPADEVVRQMMEEYHDTLQRLSGQSFA
ncbi:MAG: nitronate monooxygenase, partial [Bacilli bacterium]